MAFSSPNTCWHIVLDDAGSIQKHAAHKLILQVDRVRQLQSDPTGDQRDVMRSTAGETHSFARPRKKLLQVFIQQSHPPAWCE